MAVVVPQGFRVGGLHCGIKRNPGKPDLSLVWSERPATAAGVYTKNRVFAASVGRNRKLTPSADARGVVINSGNANACTGPRGDADAEQISKTVASLFGAQAQQVLGLSTGVIGHFLPMAVIEAGLKRLAPELKGDAAGLEAAARGMMTTDTVPKIACRQLTLGGKQVTISGIAKGAAMIAPNMATMLAVVMTDAALDPQTAQQSLAAAADDSFNCVSIDGHMSTNDTVLLLANGAAGMSPLAGADLEKFQTALAEVCAELAKAMAADGEGATHLITIDLTGCASREHAHLMAKEVAESMLVKTAIHGADPNWGRIISAIGYAGVPFDTNRVTLTVNGFRLFEKGSPVAFDAAAVSNSIRSQRDTHIELAFAEGDAKLRFWTTDLTAEYVRLNADYTT